MYGGRLGRLRLPVALVARLLVARIDRWRTAMEFLRTLFSPNDFMPHGFCYSWNAGLVWLHVISDSLIALAYLSIPVTLVYFIRKRRDVPFIWVFVCFGAFILAGGGTRLMEVWTLWHASYWHSVALKSVTAVA